MDLREKIEALLKEDKKYNNNPEFYKLEQVLDEKLEEFASIIIFSVGFFILISLYLQIIIFEALLKKHSKIRLQLNTPTQTVNNSNI